MTGSPGRPLSPELSAQLVAVAVDILADEGWSRLNSDRIAARAHAGKAGIYRRWPTMAALARDALAQFSLISLPEDAGSLRGDLIALATCWTRPLNREERAVASVVGAARHESDLRSGLDAALVGPLADAVREIGDRAVRRGELVDDGRMALLGSVLEAFWWQRYTTAGAGGISRDQVERVVDDVLMPVVRPLRDAVPVPV